MKALTLIQPWAYAVEYLGKRVENRTWTPSVAVLGQRIAIHAGKKVDWLAVAGLRSEGHTVDETQVVRGAITCTAVVTALATRHTGELGRFTAFHSGEGRTWPIPPDPWFDLSFKPWWVGPIGWVLVDVVPLAEPVPCRGAQGLWTVPDDVASRVRALSRSAA